MKFLKNTKLNGKLSILCIFLAVVICAGCCISGYIQYRDSIYKRYNDFAYEIGEVARSYVDGDKIATYKSEDDIDKSYEQMSKNIYNLYRNTSLYTNKSGIYIYIPDEKKTKDAPNGTISNLYDVRIVEIDEENRPYFEIGWVDPIQVEHPEHVFEIFKTGKRSDDYFIHESKYGYNSTAVLPIYDSNSNIVALLAADMPIPEITKTLNRYLYLTVIITVLIVAVFMILFITILRNTVTKPLKTIVKEAENFSKADIELSEVLPTIKQKDEIGQLAGTIYDMEKDIQDYVNNLTRITAENERIGAELNVATHIQASMLPCIFPAFPDRDEFDIFASMNPAKEVGGDFYDYFMVDDTHIAIVMADVSGKGVPAALFMVIAKTLIKDHTALGKSLGDIFSDVNEILCESNSGEMFVTAFEGVLDIVTGEFTFVNAGHEMPFICKAGGDFEPYKIRPGFVLAGMEGMVYKGGSITLEPGDKIFQYTDGVTEATDKNEKLFGMERLAETLNKNKDKTPDKLLPAVKADIDAFVGEAPQFDDITMLCLEYKKRGTSKQ